MAHSDLDIRDPQPATLTALLAGRARSQPDDLAFGFLSDGTTVRDTVTYAELDRAARRIAGVLHSEPVRNEPVLLLYSPSLDYVAAFFGCLYAGAIAVPAYPPHRNRSLDRLQSIVRDSGARVVLCSQAVYDSLTQSLADAPELRRLHWIATDAPGIDAPPHFDENARPDTLAFLQYTSGSTSTPKGVMLSHGNLFHNAQLITRGFNLGHDSAAVFWLPLYHDMGLIGGVLQPMQIGRPSYLMAPASFLARPMRWLQAVSHFRATISGAPNFAYELCVDKATPEEIAQLDLCRWVVAFNGAEPVRAETLKRFAEKFAPCGFRPEAAYPCYGLAESTLIVTGGGHDRLPVTLSVSRSGLEQHRVELIERDHPDSRVVVGCGSPLLDTRVVIVDPETRAVCPPDRPGEIWIAGPSVARGYWQRPELSAETFAARTAEGDGPFLRTGDLGFLHDGDLFVTGRIKDLIILRGRNHYPQDIEQTAERCHEAIRPACCAAFSVEDADGEQLVVAAELERTSRKLSIDPVIDAIRRAVAERHEVMVDCVLLLKPGSIPKTSSGKIQRHACRSGFRDGTLEVIGRWDRPNDRDAAAAPPAASIGAAAVRSWLVERIAARLRLDPAAIDARQPLAAFGLDSLSAVQLVGELEQWLGRPLSPVLIYDHPSIDALARFLAGAGSESDSQIEIRDPQSETEIAVIGIGCRVPGADGPNAFWKLLRDGGDAISDVPADRWNADELYSADPSAAGKMTTRRGGFLRDVDRFDRGFFGIAPREAERMDPQQRLLLETTWEAFDDAGVNVDRLAGQPVGVFVGISSNDYGRLQAGDLETIDAYVGTGNALSIAANRLSFVFDFRGPSLAVDTACSSSLVAIHLACQSLRRGESRLAVAAGVNLILTPDLTINFSRANMMAPDGRCKAFDAAADGYVRSEGVGVVILKPLAQALADGDRVYAVVRGSAINQDGRSNGLTAPNRQAQEAVLRAALADAGVAPADVDAIEAHGTGTALGDPIEALAIGHVLAADRPTDRPAWIGSVKTNIGHLEAAAGIAGFIKMALALHHGELPASLHFQSPNPHIPFTELPIRVARDRQPLPSESRPAIVGVSSFGFGGANAHVVLQALAGQPSPSAAGPEVHLIPLSARTSGALRDLAQRWLDWLPGCEASLTDVAYSAALRRTHHDHRLTLVARDRAALIDQLQAVINNEPRAQSALGRRLNNREPRIAFVFSGQGSQWWGMGRRLLECEPVFRDAIERCDAVFRPLAGWSILDLLQNENNPERLDDTDRVQPAIFALQIALAELWRSWGVAPSAVVGHSLGEVAAACVAGSLDLAEGLRIVWHRARLQHSRRGEGKMAAVALSVEESRSVLNGLSDRVAIAAINGPRATVWSGDPAAIDKALEPLRRQDVFHRVLRGQVAFHSPQMDSLRDELIRSIGPLRPRAAATAFYSTVTGRGEPGDVLTADYWARNLREPVAFQSAVDSILAAGVDAFVEIGPHPTLLEPIRQRLNDPAGSIAVLGSLRRGEDDRSALLATLGALYTLGAPVAWDAVEPAGRWTPLPGYPWQRERCWYVAARTSRPVELSAPQVAEPSPHDGWLVRPEWERVAMPAAAGTLAGNWLVIGNRPATLERLAAPLRRRGATVELVVLGDRNEREPNGRWRIDPNDLDAWKRLVRDAVPVGASLRGVIHAAGVTAPSTAGLDAADLSSAADHGCTALLHLVQALVHYGATPRLWITTRGAQPVQTGAPVAVAAASIWGLGRVLDHEHPELRPTLLDLDPAPQPDDFESLAELIRAEPEEHQWALRSGGVWAARLKPAADALTSAAPAIRSDATYLITGGLGGLGLATARWLVEHGARSIVLTSRRGPSAEQEAVLESLRNRGAAVRAAAVDAADAAALRDLIAEIDETLPPLRGVLHLAGVLDDGIALHMTRDRLWTVLRPKVLGGWNLHAITADRPLDWFVLFSSAASILGSPGQSSYAAANAFLDALAHHRRARGLPGVSINWGPWSEVGMAARDGRADRLAGAGMESIPVNIGLAILERLMAAAIAQIGVLPIDAKAWKRLAANGAVPPYLAALAGPGEPAPAAVSAQPSALNRAALLAAPPGDWQPILEAQLREQAARVLRLPADQLEVEQPLNNAGIDSLMAIELKNRIEADLGASVPMVKFLEGPSVRDLAGFLAEQLQPLLVPQRAAAGRNGSAQRNGAAATAPRESEAANGHLELDAGELLARLDTLSDAEVDSLLSELCDAEKGA